MSVGQARVKHTSHHIVGNAYRFIIPHLFDTKKKTPTPYGVGVILIDPFCIESQLNRLYSFHILALGKGLWAKLVYISLALVSVLVLFFSLFLACVLCRKYSSYNNHKFCNSLHPYMVSFALILRRTAIPSLRAIGTIIRAGCFVCYKNKASEQHSANRR